MRPCTKASSSYFSVGFSVVVVDGSDFFSASAVLVDRSGVPDGER